VVGRNLLARGESIRHSPAETAAVAVELAQESRASRLGPRNMVLSMSGNFAG
jgi:hypothetical protein